MQSKVYSLEEFSCGSFFAGLDPADFCVHASAPVEGTPAEYNWREHKARVM